MNKQWTVGSILQWTQRFFAEKEIDTPRLDAEILLAHVLGKERIYLYAHYDEPMTPGELAAYKDIIKKIKGGPLSGRPYFGCTALYGP